MNVALRKPMSRQEFFAWAEAQDERYEFDGFQPVAMTGDNLGHSSVAGNIIQQLRNRLAGKPAGRSALTPVSRRSATRFATRMRWSPVRGSAAATTWCRTPSSCLKS
jgi:hypothetical protein